MKPTKSKLALTTILAAGFGALVLSGTAEAKPAKPGHVKAHKAELMKKFDTNGDGVLSADEKKALRAYRKSMRKGKGKAMRAHKRGHGKHKAKRQGKKRGHNRAAMLKKFDVNNNGKLDKAERSTMHQVRFAKRFAKLDTNNNGVIELAEAQGRMAKRFKRIDTNSNGVITKAELRAAKKARKGRKGKGKRRGKKAVLPMFPKPPVAPVATPKLTFRALPATAHVRPTRRDHTGSSWSTRLRASFSFSI